MSFGKHLQALRERMGLSQSGLAKQAGIPVRSIQNWEVDRSLPRFDAVVKLAEALGLPLEQLAAGIGKKRRRPRKRKSG
jgi:transcriptional regulator with XRE-family HTH domain